MKTALYWLIQCIWGLPQTVLGAALLSAYENWSRPIVGWLQFLIHAGGADQTEHAGSHRNEE